MFNHLNIFVGSNGFEPLKAKPADLQSALVDRWSNFPSIFYLKKTNLNAYFFKSEPAEGFEPPTR